MKRILLLATCLALFAAPAYAKSCGFENDGGDSLRFLDKGESEVALTAKSGDATCTWANGENGPDLDCGQGATPAFFIGAARNDTSARILIWNEEAWYPAACR